jgi:trehalose utilization protein
MPVSVTVWNEYQSQRGSADWMGQGQQEQARKAMKVYPDGIHAVIAEFLSEAGFETRTATFEEPDHGLTPEILDRTDVLVWWSHHLNDEVDDRVVERVYQRVQDGMGLIVLHSARNSKIFQRLMGTTCKVQENRNNNETERLWVLERSHPIASNLGTDSIEIPESQIMAEPFQIPDPKDVVFTSWIEGGEIFRSGCCFQRGAGRIFYFGPGHETHPVFYQTDIQQIIANSVRWAAPTKKRSSS